MTVKNIGASVRARINNKAKADNVNTQFLLTRYALERMLYRLAVFEHRDCRPKSAWSNQTVKG
jgi:hypothetical protein